MRLWGSLAVEDRLRSRDHLRLRIICGAVQYCTDQMVLTKTAMSELRSVLSFTQLRFHSRKKKMEEPST